MYKETRSQMFKITLWPQYLHVPEVSCEYWAATNIGTPPMLTGQWRPMGKEELPKTWSWGSGMRVFFIIELKSN